MVSEFIPLWCTWQGTPRKHSRHDNTLAKVIMAGMSSLSAGRYGMSDAQTIEILTNHYRIVLAITTTVNVTRPHFFVHDSTNTIPL